MHNREENQQETQRRFPGTQARLVLEPGNGRPGMPRLRNSPIRIPLVFKNLASRWPALRNPGLAANSRNIALILGCCLLILSGCETNRKPTPFVPENETQGPIKLEKRYLFSEFTGKQKGSLFSIKPDGSNLKDLMEYLEAMPNGPFIHEGNVNYYSSDSRDSRYSAITCQRQRPFTNHKWPGSPDLPPAETAPAPRNDAEIKNQTLWNADAERAPAYLQFRCDLDSGNGLYWGHVILTTIFEHVSDQNYKLIFRYGFGTKHEDYIYFKDLNGDGIYEIWIQDQNYDNEMVFIEKQDKQGIYRTVFQFDTYQGFTGGCYGYDGSLQIRSRGLGRMPDLVLHTKALFNAEGGCYPAAKSKAESRAMIQCMKDTIAGAYVVRYGGFGYQGGDDLKNLHSEDCFYQ